MNLIFTTFLILFVGSYITENAESAEISIPAPPPLKIDKNLRKALLKALEKLDAEDLGSSENKESREVKENEEEEILDTSTDKEEEFLKLPITVKDLDDEDEDIKADVFIHSLNTDTPNKKEEKKKSLVDSNDVTVTKSLEKNVNTPSSTKSNEIPLISLINKGIDSSNRFLFKSENLNLVGNSNLRQVPVGPLLQKSNLPTPNPTSSTPTDEDISNVKVEDVQFIHAPLVAAFTVQQDDKGLPHKVIPIFGSKSTQLKDQISKQQTFSSKVQSLEQKQRSLEQEILYLQEKRRQEELRLTQQLSAQEIKNHFKSKPIIETSDKNFENSQPFEKPIKPAVNFENTQLFTEQQLPLQPVSINFNSDKPFVQSQANKNAITQQQLPLQQNSFTFNIPQTLKTENVKIQKAQSFPVQQQVFQPEQIRQANTAVNSQTSITVQPSLSFQPSRLTSGIVPTTQLQYSELQFAGQQPPFKEAVNFQQTQTIPFFTQNRNTAFTQQQLPLQFATQTFDTLRYNDNYLHELRASLRTQLPPLPPVPAQSTRVFRQESQTGNFGVNNFSANRNRFQQNQISNVETLRSNSISLRPFESRPYNLNFQDHNQFNIDTRLKNLFYQSGFGQGRSQEDFNIVSKVLALDHTR